MMPNNRTTNASGIGLCGSDSVSKGLHIRPGLLAEVIRQVYASPDVQ